MGSKVTTHSPAERQRAHLPLRAAVSLSAGQVAGTVSRTLGRGGGSVISGSVALRLYPRALEVLSAGRRSALVSATNGKSTTTQLLAAALETLGPVAHNRGGSNMANGLVTALAAARDAPLAALEVDEAYLGPVSRAVRPATITLMNLSHEFTRGVSYKREARHWRETVDGIGPDCVIVANADDPVVAWSVRGAPRVVWVAGGLLWKENALLCRGCLAPLTWAGPAYRCERCGLARPEPAWSIVDGRIRGPRGEFEPAVAMPGRANLSNALFALATADLIGADVQAAMHAMAGVAQVDGRYAEYDVDGRLVQLHMVKNSASWAEAIRVFVDDPDAGLVFAVDEFGLTGRDTATIWDAPVELLAGRPAVAAGRRRDDIAVRLQVAGVAVESVADHLLAVRRCPPGRVHVVTNYSAFNRLKRRLAP
jgi:lipid II isoglutaminyl synthase (glutamine-hydrolysing)